MTSRTDDVSIIYVVMRHHNLCYNVDIIMLEYCLQYHVNQLSGLRFDIRVFVYFFIYIVDRDEYNYHGVNYTLSCSFDQFYHNIWVPQQGQTQGSGEGGSVV